MYRVKNKFEVMHTREQVQYETENIMEILLVTYFMSIDLIVTRGQSWSYGRRIKHYLCNQFPSTLTL